MGWSRVDAWAARQVNLNHGYLGVDSEGGNTIDLDYSSKNHVRKFLRTLPLKWRAKVTTIEEAKDLVTLPLDELIRNLKVYEMVLDNDGVDSKTTKEKVKSLALKAKVTREKTSVDSDSQGESDEEEAEAFNLLARNFRKFFRKGNRFGRARSQRDHATIAALKAISLVNVESQRKTWRNIEDGDEQL
ncbi:UBN2 domain-containing protein, partial [Tanacetum coccineum]